MATYPVNRPIPDTCMRPDCDATGELLVEHLGRIIGKTCGPHAEAALASWEATEIRGTSAEMTVLVLADRKPGGSTVFDSARP